MFEQKLVLTMLARGHVQALRNSSIWRHRSVSNRLRPRDRFAISYLFGNYWTLLSHDEAVAWVREPAFTMKIFA